MFSANAGVVAFQKTNFSFGPNNTESHRLSGATESFFNFPSTSLNVDIKYKHFCFGFNYNYSKTMFEGMEVERSAYYTVQNGNHTSTTISQHFLIQQNVTNIWSKKSLKVGGVVDLNKKSTLMICLLIPINYVVTETTNTTVQNPEHIPLVDELSGFKTIKTDYSISKNLHSLPIALDVNHSNGYIYPVINFNINYSYYLTKYFAINTELNTSFLKIEQYRGIGNPYDFSQTYNGFQSIYNMSRQKIFLVNAGLLFRL